MLNPTLYKALEAAYADVVVYNEDQPLTLDRTPSDSVFSGGRRDRVTSDMVGDGGEYYAVNCPFCNDTRKRLWVCYAWGSTVEVNHKQFKVSKGVAHCFNEHCLDNKDHWLSFCKSVEGSWKPVLVQAGMEYDRLANDKDDFTVDMPEGNYYVDHPHGDKRVQAYLESRGYDLMDLRHHWDFRIGKIHFYDVPCVIMPVVCQGNYKFWQARYPVNGEIPEFFKDGRRKPKYYIPAGAKKSRVLYNLDKALKTDTVVLVEGILDAVRIGPSGVAMFGKKPSTRQQMMLLGAKQKRVLWIPDMDDPEALAYANRYVDTWNRSGMFEKPAHVVKLDEGDPAEYTREELWQLIEKSLATS